MRIYRMHLPPDVSMLDVSTYILCETWGTDTFLPPSVYFHSLLCGWQFAWLQLQKSFIQIFEYTT